MSIRHFLYLSLGLMLILLLTLVYSGYRQSEKTISYLNTFAELHVITLRKIERATTLVLIADHNFELLNIPPEVPVDGVVIIFEHLMRTTHLPELIPAHRKIIDAHIELIKKPLSDILQSRNQSEQAQLLPDFNRNIQQFGQQLLLIHKQINALPDSQNLLNKIKDARALLTELEIHLLNFTLQQIYEPQKVVVPLEEAISEIEDILLIAHGDSSILVEITAEKESDVNPAISSQSNSPKLKETVAISKMADLSGNFRRLIAAVNFYVDELNKLDPSAAYDSRASELVGELRDLVRKQLAQIKNELEQNIAHQQQELIASSTANQRLFLVMSILSIIISLGVALYLSGLISGAIKALLEGAREFSSGNLNYRIGKIKTSEFTEVSGVFNQMAASLEEDQVKLRDIVQKLYESNRDLDVRVAARTKELEYAMQAATDANQAKSLFLSNMSHELRTPMHAILSFSELGVAKVEDADKKNMVHYFNRIHESGQRLLSLIGDLLDLSKLESGKIEYRFVKQDLVKVIDAASTELGSLLKDKAINLARNSNSGIEFFFDADKIHQVLINLLSNAIKFSPTDSTIRIDCKKSFLANGHRRNDPVDTPAVEITISDQGVGIPQDQLEVIFDKFIQSNKTTADDGGTGLGLAITREIVEGHFGMIKAQNRQQGGAEFIFTLPIQPTANQNP